MPRNDLADLVSGVPGHYAFRRHDYLLAESFDFDLNVARDFCEKRGFSFDAVGTEEARSADAFFVEIDAGRANWPRIS